MRIFGAMFTRLLILILVLLSTPAWLNAQWQWVDDSQASSNFERVEDVALDETRNAIYSVGFVTGNPSFPEISGSELSGEEDGFVMKYDLNGNVLWAFAIGGTGDDRVHGVTVDEGTGNIFITGYLRGSFATHETELVGESGGLAGNVTGASGGDDAFVACYNVFGQLIWYRILGGSGFDRGMDIDVNASGVFMTGVYTNNTIIGTLIPLLPFNGEINNFVIALNSNNGNTLWDAVLASTADDYVVPSSDDDIKRTGITADASGVYLVTYFNGATYRVYNSSDVLSASISDPNTSQQDFVVTAYSNSGNHNWSVLYDNTGTLTFGLDITNDCSGVYVSGTLLDGSSTPGGTVISSNHDDVILSKLNKTTGSEIWLKEFNSNVNNFDHFVGIEADGYGNLYAVGRLRGTQLSVSSNFNFTGGTSNDKVMIAHFHSDGAFQSFEVLPGSDDSWGMSIATYKNEKYVVGGYYNNALNFGSLAPSNNQENAFVATRNLSLALDYVSGTGNEILGNPVFCQSEGSVLPDINVVAGGAFSAPIQVVFANASTGEINLAASTPGGPYTISYSSPILACGTSALTTSIYILADQNAAFSYANTTFCSNQPNPTPTFVATPGGTFSGPPQLVFANTSTGEINIAASTPGGPYNLVYTTSSPYCPSADTIQVYVTNPPNANFIYNNSSYCQGTGSISPTFIGTSGGSFSASPGIVFNNTNTGQINLNASAVGGPYTIQYTVSNGGCLNSSTLTMTILAPEDASFSYSDVHFCTNEPNPTAASITQSGGVFSGPPELVFANLSTGEINVAASTIGGPYYLVYTTSGSQCADSDSIQVYIEDTPDPAFSYAQTLFCSGTGTVLPNSVATSGGTFTAPVGIVFANATTGEIDLNASTVGGPYTIQYTVSNAFCQESSTFELTIQQTEDASFSYLDVHFCTNEPNPTAASITQPGGVFSGPPELVIANASTGEIDVAASTIGGPYYLVYTTSGLQCADSDSIQVYIEDTPDPTFSYAQTLFCSGTGTVLPNSVATSGGTFTAPVGIVFANAATGEIDLNASTVGGPYTIQYTVSNAYCQESSTFELTIQQTEDASFSYSDVHFCINEPNPTAASITQPGGVFSGPPELVFANPSTGEIDVAASTIGGPYYLVYTTSGLQCADSDSIQVYIEDTPDPAFSYAQTLFCSGTGTVLPNSVATSGGTFTAPAGIVFANATTGEIDLNTSTVGGPYTIQYTVSNAYCQESSTFELTIQQTEDASFSYSDVHFCINEPNPTAASITQPGGVFSGPPELVIANASTGEIDVAASTIGGPYYLVYTTSGLQCADSDSIQVYIEDTPDPSFSYAQTLFCSGTGTVLPNSVATSGGTFTAPAGIVFINAATGEIDLNASTVGGPYTIQYSVSNAYCQESSTFELTIQQTEDASFSYSDVHFCINEPNPIASSITTPGGIFSGPPELVIANASTGEIDVSASTIGGPYYLVYTTSGLQCADSDSIQVYLDDIPNASFSYAQPTYCSGAGTTVLPSSITTLGGTFSGPSGLVLNSTTGAIDIDASLVGGPYSVEYLVSNSYCQELTTFDITILQQDNLVSVEYSAENYCISDVNQTPVVNGLSSGVFSASNAIDLLNTATGEFSPATSAPGGPYFIQYLTLGVCPDSIEVPISIYEVPTAFAGEDQELLFVFSSSLDANATLLGNGQWSTPSSALIDDVFNPNSEVSTLSIGANTFIWTVTNGVCPSVSDEVIIEVRDLFIPQAVTPNNDGKNDFFELYSLEESTCSLQLFNRWGQVIYENSDYQNEWYGQNMNGKQLENDTYFYVILIDDSISYNGYVVLKK